MGTEKKRLGILGGMGSEATEVFFKRIIEHTKVKNDREHLDIFIYNHASLPDRTEYIITGRTDELWEIIKGDIHTLEAVKSDYIAIPCNTCHFFADRLDEATDHHFINMITETAAFAKTTGAKKVGVMGTTGTVRSDLYKKALNLHGIEAVYPDDEYQDVVMDIIYGQIKKGDKGSMSDFSRVVDHFSEKSCDAVILACTELSVFRENYMITDPFFIDALDVLARACITMCGGALRIV
ncbi:MAG: amino acid racemase [Lachnospiraceae bacterium]|nr:amino acid racemase [Lachnospiraceae bacterium]